MDFLNSSSKTDLFEKTKKVAGAKSDEPAQHDFFAPLNEMDPHTKQPQKIEAPKFDFRIFFLHGCAPERAEVERKAYLEIKNKIATGEYHELESKTFHNRDGDIKVFLQWLEVPEKFRPDIFREMKPPSDKDFDNAIAINMGSTSKVEM